VSDQLEGLKTALSSRYAIEREIGAGGMATVYLAEDLKHHRKVAVKVLRPVLAAALGADRFHREIEIAANLNHPHVLPLLDSGDADGFLYYVMPYVEGQSLRDKLAHEGELPIAEAVRILRDVVDALDHAHKHRVVHRDIKPDNVMLSGRHALVTDFGVAKAVSEATGRQQLTTEGIALGTPTYMSPEQAAADPHIDHRADIYSVGAVAYELLTGRPPFLGTTPQMILSAHMTDTPEPVTKYREAVPPALAELVMTCLEKKAADRWQSTEEMLVRLEALATPSGGITPTGTQPVAAVARGRRAAIGGVATVGLIVVAVVVGVLLRSRSEPGVDANLLAVAPFDVLSQQEELAVWGEGIMDLLSRSLDGAGPLRTLSPTMSVRRWEGRADAASAAAFGRRAGAGLVVYGTLVGVGSDSARVVATLLDVARGSALAEAELRDRADRVDRLSDSLAVRLLAGLSRRWSIAGAPLYSLGSTSPAAIKAFLQGEAHYRRSSWDSARAYYEQAVDLDSSFALAYRKIGIVLGWNELEFGLGSAALLPYQLRAGELNHGLAPRESLLIVAESLYAGLTPSFDGDWSRIDRLLATMEHAARRYPEDPEVWNELGEARFHFGQSAGVTLEATQEAFRRAIALDSGFAPAYIHATELALRLGGAAAGRRTLAGLLALGPAGYEAGAAHLAQALLDPERAQSAAVEAALDTLSDLAMAHAITHLQYYPDSAESAVRVARAWAERSSGSLSDLRWLLAFRGHVDEAYQVLEQSDWRTPQVTNWFAQSTFAELALLGALPDDTVRAVYDAWLSAGYGQGTYLANRWRADRGDTVSLQRIIQISEIGLGQLRGAQHPDTALVWWASQCATAYLSLARGDTTAALEEFDTLKEWPAVPWAYKERLTRAQLLAAVGRDEEAATILDQIPSVGYVPGPVEVIWILERARVNDRLGNREKAVESYSYVMDVWRNADPLLQPFVTEARTALARLAGEPSR
jgi:tetratricopeptide (TPR) repeat protein/tRNA A-37 threonylcarbamoyl transferase component Bud32